MRFFDTEARRARPTIKHVPLLWENILGTVVARNPETAEIKYFDYDWKKAREWARVEAAKDLRISRVESGILNWAGYAKGWEHNPRKSQLVLWGVHPQRFWEKGTDGKMVYVAKGE